VSSSPLLADSPDYPLLDLFWTMLWFFLWILWIFLVVRIVSDIFRSEDLHGWGKAGWTLFVIVLPFIGIFSYLIVRGASMQRREVKGARADDEARKAYIQQAAGSTTSSADELSKLADLHRSGVLTDTEFAQQKAKLLA
jgi:type VI protein secretion system component VasK